MRLLQSERVSEVGARPSEALVKFVRTRPCNVTGERELVASTPTREVARDRHQILPDSRGARVRIDDDIFDYRERLQRMTQVRHDDHMTGADDFTGGFSYEDRVIAIAREAIEGRRELRRRYSQAQVILQVQLIVEFLQARQIGFARAPDSDRGVVASGI